MLSIGEFSKICGVSTKTLRYYDETGLLKPTEINPESGYRYYAISQLKTMLFINRLKAYHFSLEDIRDLLLDDPTEERLGAALQRKQEDIRDMLAEYGYILQKMQGDITNIERGIPVMSYLDHIEVQLAETQPMNILSIRKVTSTGEHSTFFPQLFATIAKENLTPMGPPMTIYHDPEFKPEASDTEFAVPVKEAVKGTRELPGMLCAKSIHRGPYEELTAAYAGLQAWIEKEGYAVVDAPFEVYLTDYTKLPQEQMVTEVYFPVKKK